MKPGRVASVSEHREAMLTFRDRRRARDELDLVALVADGVPHRIFDPFWSGDEAGAAGTGLGLYIAKAHVQALGGRIRARNRQTGGSRIAFTLPLCPPSSPEAPA